MEVQQPVEKSYYKKKDKYVRIVVFILWFPIDDNWQKVFKNRIICLLSVYKISPFFFRSLKNGILKNSKLKPEPKTLELDTLDPDRLIWISTVKTFNFLFNPLLLDITFTTTCNKDTFDQIQIRFWSCLYELIKNIFYHIWGLKFFWKLVLININPKLTCVQSISSPIDISQMRENKKPVFQKL